ncbi:Hydroxyindole-O-methyltransferase [Handroanthus impetiginosus]|uniref:Hydroxyindole-O-methyltransferase n=1 Tax=Handroanthus impetiginosus TaxID=429701 RepID=A0A2G9I710_9LAMI|nr:Hydroxyindole-O-methyltransferase [Handroanthus impetiginosus]
MNPPEKPIKISSNEEDEASQYAMQLVNASVMPMVLKACIELDVFGIISRKGPNAQLSPSQIASQIPCHNPDFATHLLDRMLGLLASYSILMCSVNQEERLYSLAPVSKYFLPNANGASLAPLFQADQDKIVMDTWYHIKDAVIQGESPFKRAYGMNISEYMVKDPNYLQLFRASMSSYNSMFMEKLLETYKGFEGLKSIVDVGGGDGSILKTIIGKYPTIKGINFDIPAVIENTATYPGIEQVAGDMFITIPKGDALFLKWILHSWDDEHCIRILKNCYEAIPDHGKVMLVELVVPEVPESRGDVRSKLQFDMIMMNMNPGGKRRTKREFKTLGEAAGFSSIKVECCVYSFSLVELYK